MSRKFEEPFRYYGLAAQNSKPSLRIRDQQGSLDSLVRALGVVSRWVKLTQGRAKRAVHGTRQWVRRIGIEAMRQKDERHARFKAEYPGGSLSPDLIECGQAMLERSLRDRHSEVMRNAHNHYSPNAVGAFILAVSAWEATMNELLAFWHIYGGQDHRDRAALGPLPKFVAMTGIAEHDPFAVEFRMLTRMRNELAHFLPGAATIPEDYAPLEARGLFIRTTHGPASDFQFCQKLPSYALAYWAWTTCHEAVVRAVANAPPIVQNVCDFMAHNFSLYEATCPPELLPEYDKHHGLELTPHRPQAGEAPPAP